MDNKTQVAVAREVMERRKAALRMLADHDPNIDCAINRPMREDREILRRLAAYDRGEE